MKKDITIEVLDEIDKHSNFKDYDIFKLLHDRIRIFDKYVIENCLGKTIDGVLIDLYLPSFYSSEKNNFRALSHLNFLDLFIEFLQFRYDFDYVFHQKQQIISPKNSNRIIEVSVKDFSILNNCFFDCQSFMLYGRIDHFINNEPLQYGLLENQLRIKGIEGGEMNVFISNKSADEISSIHRVYEDVVCLFYGTVSFDPHLMKNIIITRHIDNLELLENWK